MKVEVQAGDILTRADEAIVVNLFEGVAKPGGATGAVDAALGGGVTEAIRRGDFRGKKGEVLWLRPAGKIPAKRVLVVGLGEKRGFGIDGVPEASGMAAKAAREAKVKCTVLDDAKMRELGMGAVLGVAKGSNQPPKFLVLEYEGRKGMKPVALIGKGITFDTGGISLKPQDTPLGPMYEMKHDMSGAATVVATVCAVARLGLKVNVVGLAPLTENMPGGNAQKPGDVVTAFDGKTIEVLNTDAEGRLVLADALGYASKWEPQAMI